MQLRHIAKKTVENVLNKPEQIVELNGKKVLSINNIFKRIGEIFDWNFC
jgi:hypothetical protein